MIQLHGSVITARNEVGAREYFQKRVSRILSTWGEGACMPGGACVAGVHVAGVDVAGGVCEAGGMHGRGAYMMEGACVAGGTCVAGGVHWHAWQGGMHDRVCV